MQLKREKDNEQQNCHDKKETKKKKHDVTHTEKYRSHAYT